MSELNVMDAPAVKREEIISAYEESDGTDDSLTEGIRSALQHAYHFLGDMIVSQVGEHSSASSEMLISREGVTSSRLCI